MENNKKIDSPFQRTPNPPEKPVRKGSPGMGGAPWKPEPIEILRARYFAAVEKTWIPEPDMKDRPGMHYTHCFDFEDGWRLLVSKDQATDQEIIHVSASYYEMPKLNISLIEVIEIVTAKWREISTCYTWHLHLMAVTLGGVPHFFACDGVEDDRGN